MRHMTRNTCTMLNYLLRPNIAAETLRPALQSLDAEGLRKYSLNITKLLKDVGSRGQSLCSYHKNRYDQPVAAWSGCTVYCAKTNPMCQRDLARGRKCDAPPHSQIALQQPTNTNNSECTRESPSNQQKCAVLCTASAHTMRLTSHLVLTLLWKTRHSPTWLNMVYLIVMKIYKNEHTQFSL